jgi:hypothetical protein
VIGEKERAEGTERKKDRQEGKESRNLKVRKQ